MQSCNPRSLPCRCCRCPWCSPSPPRPALRRAASSSAPASCHRHRWEGAGGHGGHRGAGTKGHGQTQAALPPTCGSFQSSPSDDVAPFQGARPRHPAGGVSCSGGVPWDGARPQFRGGTHFPPPPGFQGGPALPHFKVTVQMKVLGCRFQILYTRVALGHPQKLSPSKAPWADMALTWWVNDRLSMCRAATGCSGPCLS